MKYLFLLLLFVSPAVGELIPAARLGVWSHGVHTGVVGGIPTNRTTLIDASAAPYNADKTGVADTTSAINSAITAAGANEVVLLPAGNYRVDGAINIQKNNVTLRGAAGATTITLGASGRFYFGGDTEWPYNPATGAIDITAGLTKGIATITVADGSSFSAGDLATISDLYDNTLPVVNVFKAARARSQKVRISAKSGNDLTLSPPLLWTLDAGQSPKIKRMASKWSGIGIEDLIIEANASGNSPAVDFTQVTSSWMKGVTVQNFVGHGVAFFSSHQLEMRECIIKDRRAGGSNGSGLLVERTGGCLVEDNIILNAFPLIEVNYGSAGNVFAYNFVDRSETFGLLGAGIDTNHGAHNSYNLYEGNIAPKLQADGFFGSASEDTVFRNWLHGSSALTTDYWAAVALNRFTRNYNIVGNVLGRAGYSWTFDNAGGGGSYATHYIYLFGLPNMGNLGHTSTAQLSAADPWADWAAYLAGADGSGAGDTGFQELDLDVEASTLRKGNYNYSTGSVPAGESPGGDTIPASLFRDSKPSYFGSLAWPPIDTGSLPANYEVIPAGYRYVNEASPAPDTTPPDLVSAVIAADGETITFTFNEGVTIGAGGNTGWSVNLSSGSATLAYSSGDGSTALVYAISSTILPGITGDVAYTQPGNGIEDDAGNDLANLSGVNFTNNSTVGLSSPQAGWSKRKAIKLLSR